MVLLEYRYCSRKCQTQGWPTHKKNCKLTQRERRSVITLCNEALSPAPLKDPSGYGHRLGAPKERFAGSVVLGSSSALGDALMGWRKWTDPEVVRESSTRWHSPRWSRR